MKLRAYVLDDEEVVRSLLSTLLERFGYDPEAFSDPADYFQKVEEKQSGQQVPPFSELIISDLNMPGMNGFEFAEAQREKGWDAQNIALMSGAWPLDLLKKAEQRGYKILRKPFSAKELAAWLEECKAKILEEEILTGAA
jgi:CheY-like chemotaxis protein